MKNIAVFTSTRAEYGLLLPILKRLKSDSDLNLKLLVSGSHLSDQFGFTKNQILSDGFDVEAEFPFIENSKEKEYKALSILSNDLGSYFSVNKPDLLLVLGDRFELLAVASVALVMNIPLAHISGGDVTEGAIDNQIRHALTKMSHLHFPATEIYKNNLLQMGEEEWRICVVGEPGLDEIRNLELIPKDELFNNLGLSMENKLVLATLHPETIDNQITREFIEGLIKEIMLKTDYDILFTGANFDHGGNEINELLRSMSVVEDRLTFIDSLGQKRYYSMLNYASILIGNSSSGLTEAQSFNIPVLNVGKRQQGRLFNPNVLHVSSSIVGVMEGLEYVMKNDFKTQYIDKDNIYGDGHASEKIIEKIKSVDASSLLLKKSTF